MRRRALGRIPWGGLLLGSAIAATSPSPAVAAPDLVPELFDLRVGVESVAQEDVDEGCAGGTTDRTLLRFGLRARNIGPDNLVIGDPMCPDCSANPGAVCGNPLFVCSISHGHAHFENFYRAELFDANGSLVAQGHKQSFCLMDSSCPGSNPSYTCGFQGITSGCADVYRPVLPCQYFDVTDVPLPAGTYTLRVTLNPDGLVAEGGPANNVTEAVVAIDYPVPPGGNAAADALLMLFDADRDGCVGGRGDQGLLKDFVRLRGAAAFNAWRTAESQCAVSPPPE